MSLLIVFALGQLKAIQDLDGSEFQGRNIKVNQARPREERPPRDRGPRY